MHFVNESPDLGLRDLGFFTHLHLCLIPVQNQVQQNPSDLSGAGVVAGEGERGGKLKRVETVNPGYLEQLPKTLWLDLKGHSLTGNLGFHSTCNQSGD